MRRASQPTDSRTRGLLERGFDSSGGLGFVRERLALLGKTLFLVPLTSVWTAERAEQWWTAHRPRPRDARPAADVLLSHEGRELRIGPRVRPRG